MKIMKNLPRGFSLVEVVIAIGIVAILLTTFMAVFGPAQQSISRSIGISDANRLVSTLQNEMAVLRPGEEGEYTDGDDNASAFEKAFQWIKESSEPADAIVIYQYHAQPSETNGDDTLEAIPAADATSDTSLPGRDYITQTIARRLSGNASNYIKSELQPGVVSGNVYVARMTQLVSENGELKVGSPGVITNPESGNASDSSEYEEAYITVQVEFFQMPNNLAAYVTGGNWDFEKLGSPVATQNLAVRR